jgi:excisionase family DNA binding protein
MHFNSSTHVAQFSLEVQAKNMTNLELLSIEESARNLSVSPWTLRAHIKRGAITVVRCGKRILISRAEIARIAREGLPSLSVTAEPPVSKV